jgi:hypothetical protein
MMVESKKHCRTESNLAPVQLHPGSKPDRWRNKQRYETLPCEQPVRIEIPIGIAIVGKARHVPMADQMRIGLPNWRATSDIDNSIAIALKDRVRFVCGVNFYQRPFRASPIRKRGDSSRPRNHDMTSSQSEESLDVGFVFGSRIALPGKAPVKPELSVFSYGANDADIDHQSLQRGFSWRYEFALSRSIGPLHVGRVLPQCERHPAARANNYSRRLVKSPLRGRPF